MAEYHVDLSRSAARELESLSPQIQDRVVKTIKALAQEPRPRGVRKLRGMRDVWRIRVGDYWIIYRIDDEQRLVDVGYVRHRREAYE